MFRTVVILLLLGLNSAPARALEIFTCDTDHDVPDSVAIELDKVLTNIVDPETRLAQIYGYAPGGVLSLRGPDWHYARAIGTADPDTQAVLTCRTPFQIGSNTKMMTAVVLMQLHEEGALSLSDPLSRHLPEFANALPFGDVITLRQLANHTAGVYSYTDNAPNGTPGIMEGDFADPVALRRGYTMEDLVRFAIDKGEPTFPPGSTGKWAYSNTGYVLLGLVIEKIEGRQVAESFQTRIFDPLGMSNTRYVNGIPDAELGLPRSYASAPFDVETTDWNMSQGAAAGAVVSTADDMHVFIEALLDGRLFAEDGTLAEMQVTVRTGSGTIPEYGIGIAEKAEEVWGHGGQTLGFESDVAMFVAPRLSLVGWATSGNNIMAAGVNIVSGALVNAGVIPDPAIARSEELKGMLAGPEWQLASARILGGDVIEPGSPEGYTITFESSGSFAAQADCNRILGDWTLERLVLGISPGPSTLAACSADSQSDWFVQMLENANSTFVGDDGTLVIFSKQGDSVAELFFRPKE